MRRCVGPATVLFAMAVACPAVACSMQRGYVPPTNFELTRLSDAIVVGTASVSSADELSRAGRSVPVTFTIRESVAGTYGLPTFELGGSVARVDDVRDDDFSRPRDEALTGGCIARDYRPGRDYLLFLKYEPLGGMWTLNCPAFSRCNEELPNGPSRWLDAVKHYAAISALRDPSARSTALRRLQESAAASGSNALADDIRRHFDTPTPWKEPEDLLSRVNGLPPGDLRDAALGSLALQAAPEAADLFRGLLVRPNATESELAFSAVYAVNRPDRSNLPLLMKALHAHRQPDFARWELGVAIAACATDSDRGTVKAALREVGRENGSALDRWLAEHSAH